MDVRSLALALAALLMLAPGRAFAEEVRRVIDASQVPARVRQPARVHQPSLGLGEAVMLTLLHNPTIQLAQQNVGLALGQAQVAEGVFEGTLGVAAELSVDKHENFPFLTRREEEKRSLLRSLAIGYAELNEQYLEALAQNQTTAPPCPEGLEPGDVGILEGRDRVRNTGISFEDAFAIRLDGLDQEAASIADLCRPRDEVGSRPDVVFGVVDRINEIMGLGLDDLVEDNLQLQRERLALGQHIAEAVARKADLALARNGAVPQDEINKSISLEVDYQKRLRNGVEMDVQLRLQSSQRNFRKKSFDPSFGGMGIRNEFPSLAALELSIPLGRGRGRVSAAAPERAAGENVKAQRQLLRHTMSAEVFATVLAYLDLVAAQQTLALLEESGARQQRIVELTQQLVDAGELPISDLDRVRARGAIVNGAVADERLGVLIGRFVLANAIGAEVQEISQAPLAADVFPGSLAPLEPVVPLVRQALSQRRDRSAFDRLRESQQILTEAARSDLKRQFDFFVTAGLSTLYESPFFRHLPDELDPDKRPTQSAVYYDDPAGYWRSINEAWKPFVRLGFSWDFPFNNNAAKGRLVQQRSALARSDIDVGNLERTIRDRVVDLTGRLERSREAVERRKDSITFYEQTLQASLETYRAGEISLIDLLTTEEDLTRETLQLVRALQLHLSLVTRLKFEVGSLLGFENEGTDHETVRFDPLQFVAPRDG